MGADNSKHFGASKRRFSVRIKIAVRRKGRAVGWIRYLLNPLDLQPCTTLVTNAVVSFISKGGDLKEESTVEK
jgi:hypothetical protein